MRRALFLILAIIWAQSFAQTDSSVTIPAGHKFIMQLENDLHTRTTKAGDRVEFATAADVVVDKIGRAHV